MNNRRNLLLTLFLSFCIGLSAQNFSLRLNQVTVRKAMTELKKKSGYSFVYEGADLDIEKKVNVNAHSVNTAVEQILSDQAVSYEIKGKNIIVSKKRNSSAPVFSAERQNKRKVTGTVKDRSGEPIIGASVIEKGTKNGCVTDIDGNFTIDVTPGAELEISYVGFISQNVKAEYQKAMSIGLSEDTKAIDEVVVIGYGTAKKSDLTGANVRVDLEKLNRSANVNLMQSLKGSVPGLNIGATTSAGSDPTMSIRGTNTISGSSSPLIVLDGIIYRGNLVDINMADIESVDVLKDASSTAIYGSQAANGVILITTKTAKTELKPTLEYNGSISLQGSINRGLKPVGRDGYIRQIQDAFIQESRTGAGLIDMNPNFDVTTHLRDPRALDGYLSGTDTNWFDLLSEDIPYIQNHDLSIRGKSGRHSYFVSVGYADQKNEAKNDKFKRYNIRINMDSNITEWLRIGTQSFFTISDYSGKNLTFSEMNRTPALVNPYDKNGDLETVVYNGDINPLLAVNNPDKDIRYNLSGTFYADITIPWVKGLIYRLNYSKGYTWYKHYTFDPYGNNLQGQAYKENSMQDEWTLDNIVTYKQDFGGHSINATFVYGVEKRSYENTESTSNNFTDKTLGYNNMGQGQANLNEIASSAWEETSLYSMLRAVYSYNGKYVVTGTIRRDGFSGFGENHKFGYFPSVGAAWIMSEEDFMKGIHQIDNLKVRASYGTNGNRTAGRYSTQALVSSGYGYVFGKSGSPELYQSISRLQNPDLKWETTSSLNLGIDFSMFGGRLFGNYDFYVSTTKDLLYNISIPVINGVLNSSVPTNIGKLRNAGHELSLTGIPIRTKDFEWRITGNFSTNRNKVLTILGYDANGDGKEDDLVSSNIFIGKPLNSVYDYNIIGMWQVSDYQQGIIPTGFTYGTYKVEDLDDSGSITADKDREIIGYKDPLYRFSIQNTFTYRDFELSFLINSVQGGSNHYLGQPLANLYRPDALTLYEYFNFDYWTPENPNAKYGSLSNYNESLGRSFSPWVSRSFIRLQNISLTYNLPKSFVRKLNVNRAKIYVSATNLFTITNWDGWDPEAGQGVTYDLGTGVYPTMRTYTLGLNFEF